MAIRAVVLFCAFFSPKSSAQDKGDIDAITAKYVIPYWQISQDAYKDDAVSTNTPGWTRVADWQSVFRTGGYNWWEIEAIKLSGFYGALYQNQTGELSIAYRGTEQLNDLTAYGLARLGVKNPQYWAAAKLASLAKAQYSPGLLTVTGDSLGGGLATYAAEQNKEIVNSVVAFSPVRSPLTSGGSNSNQINIVVAGELIGDQNTQTRLGSGSYPGKTYYVHSTTADAPQPNTPIGGVKSIYGEFTGAHSLEGIGGGLCNLSPASCRAAPPPPPIPAAPPSWKSPSTTFTPSSSLSAIPPSSHPTPGGISLSKAAAARMPLNIALDGAYYKDGRLVLSGRSDRESGFDAGLFLTGLRAACEPIDPYFSLDPEDASAWNADGQSASAVLWEHIKGDLNWGRKAVAKPRNTASSLTVRTVSARRDYPRLWHEMSQNHPNLKARLVFRPEWLRQTRFGEILYNGDILLKELASGVPLLGATGLRAGAIHGYVSASARGVTRGLRSVFEDGLSKNTSPQWQSNRLWFDLAPPLVGSMSMSGTYAALAQPPKEPEQLAKLESVMRGRGLLPQQISMKLLERTIAKDADALDVSHIYPKMFVRRTKDGKDILGSDPDLDGLSDDLNQNVEEYAAQYRELKLLNELFRAYIVAVQITNQNEDVCSRLEALPLLDAERVSEPLPEFHPSELFITIGMYEFSVPKGRSLLSVNTASVNGGVSIGGKLYSAAQMVVGGTFLTQSLNRATISHPEEVSWSADDRQFIAFNVESDMPVAEIQPDIENEPPAATLPK